MSKLFLFYYIKLIFQEKIIAKSNKPIFNELFLEYFLKNDIHNFFEVSESDYIFLNFISKIFKDFELGFIYVFKINNKIKIGKTKNITKRIGAYNSHNGITPEIIKIVFTNNLSDIEKKIITICKDYQYTKEWLKLEALPTINDYFKKI